VRKILSVVCLFALIDSAQGQTTELSGVNLTIRAAQGYCNVNNAAVLEHLQSLAMDRKVLALAIWCSEMQQLMAGAAIRKYIVWSVETSNGTPLLMSSEITRSVFAAGVAEGLPKLSGSEIASKINAHMREQGIGVNVTLQNFGLIDREQDCVYFAEVSDLNTIDQHKMTVASVTGMAEVGHYSLSINAYDKFESGATYDNLLQTVKQSMDPILADNKE